MFCSQSHIYERDTFFPFSLLHSDFLTQFFYLSFIIFYSTEQLWGKTSWIVSLSGKLFMSIGKSKKLSFLLSLVQHLSFDCKVYRYWMQSDIESIYRVNFLYRSFHSLLIFPIINYNISKSFGSPLSTYILYRTVWLVHILSKNDFH